MLINIYNANNEPDQLKIRTDLGEVLECVVIFKIKIQFSGVDLNIIFDSFFEMQGEKSSLKKHTLVNIIQIKEKLNLADIWRTRNPKTLLSKVFLSDNTIQ